MITSLACLYRSTRLAASVSRSALSSREKISLLVKPNCGENFWKKTPTKLSASPKSPVQPSRNMAAWPDWVALL